MKKTLLAVLLLTAGVASAAVVKFSDQSISATDNLTDVLQKNRSYALPPAFDLDNRPVGLYVADSHNSVPGHVFEQVDRHPLGCCQIDAAAGSVPVPAAAWLFMSGLAGLIRLARHRRRQD